MATNTTTTSLSTLVENRIRLKEQLDSLTEQLKALDEVVIAEFQKEGLSKVETVLGKVNLVQSNTVVWNEEVLEDRLTTAQWNRVTVRKIDKVRLDAEILVGRIDAELVDDAKSIKQSKPFLR
jgi:predicted nuclease with TOPRIM domain